MAHDNDRRSNEASDGEDRAEDDGEVAEDDAAASEVNLVDCSQ